MNPDYQTLLLASYLELLVGLMHLQTKRTKEDLVEALEESSLQEWIQELDHTSREIIRLPLVMLFRDKKKLRKAISYLKCDTYLKKRGLEDDGSGNL